MFHDREKAATTATHLSNSNASLIVALWREYHLFVIILKLWGYFLLAVAEKPP